MGVNGPETIYRHGETEEKEEERKCWVQEMRERFHQSHRVCMSCVYNKAVTSPHIFQLEIVIEAGKESYSLRRRPMGDLPSDPTITRSNELRREITRVLKQVETSANDIVAYGSSLRGFPWDQSDFEQSTKSDPLDDQTRSEYRSSNLLEPLPSYFPFFPFPCSLRRGKMDPRMLPLSLAVGFCLCACVFVYVMDLYPNVFFQGDRSINSLSGSWWGVWRNSSAIYPPAASYHRGAGIAYAVSLAYDILYGLVSHPGFLTDASVSLAFILKVLVHVLGMTMSFVHGYGLAPIWQLENMEGRSFLPLRFCVWSFTAGTIALVSHFLKPSSAFTMQDAHSLLHSIIYTQGMVFLGFLAICITEKWISRILLLGSVVCAYMHQTKLRNSYLWFISRSRQQSSSPSDWIKKGKNRMTKEKSESPEMKTCSSQISSELSSLGRPPVRKSEHRRDSVPAQLLYTLQDIDKEVSDADERSPSLRYRLNRRERNSSEQDRSPNIHEYNPPTQKTAEVIDDHSRIWSDSDSNDSISNSLNPEKIVKESRIEKLRTTLLWNLRISVFVWTLFPVIWFFGIFDWLDEWTLDAMFVVLDVLAKILYPSALAISTFVVTQIKEDLDLQIKAVNYADIARLLRWAKVYLKIAHDTAEDSLFQQKSFIATISHELRDPLNGVITHLEILQETLELSNFSNFSSSQAVDRENSSEAQSFVSSSSSSQSNGFHPSSCVENALGSAEKLLEVIDRILEFTRLSTQHAALQFQKSSVKTMEEWLHLTFGPLACRKSISFQVNSEFVHKHGNMEHWQDFNRVRRIIYLIVENAIKFTNKHGSVSVSFHPGQIKSSQSENSIDFEPVIRRASRFFKLPTEDTRSKTSSCCIIIQDSGVGMTSSELSRVFSVFRQGFGGNTRPFSGTGLGLAISKLLLESIGGTIEIHSERDKGTQVTIVYPIFRDDISQNDEVIVAIPDFREVIDAVSDIEQRRSSLDSPIEGEEADIDANSECSSDSLSPNGMEFQDLVNPSREYPTTMGEESIAPSLLTRASSFLCSKELQNQKIFDLHVLIVEDTEVNRKVLKRLVERLGCSAEVATDGLECLDMILNRGLQSWDCILMDVQMPRMDGIETTKRIRIFENAHRKLLFKDHFVRKEESSRLIPIYICAVTASALAEERDECLAAGMNEHLPKPVKIATLEQLIRRVAARKALYDPTCRSES